MFQGTKQRTASNAAIRKTIKLATARIWGFLSYLKEGISFLLFKTPHPFSIHTKATIQSYFFITSLIYSFVSNMVFYLRELNEM